MSLILINLAGMFLIGSIIWWFWIAEVRARPIAETGAIEILVEGGTYQPARIEVPVGKPLTLRFVRKDPSPCAEKVLFDRLGISRDLTVGKPEEITLVPKQPGVFEFTCQMGMYRGRLIVK